jgi:hypothetical protein
MSIALVQPSLLLNSYAFTNGPLGGCGMFMDKTWNCPKQTTAIHIVNWIISAWASTPNKHLHNVVLNFHGREEGPSHGDAKEPMVIVGEAVPESGSGSHFKEAIHHVLDLTNVGAFSALRGKKIGTIWFHSCALAKDLKGKYFCQRMAEVSGCKVVAASETQEEWWGIINLIFMPRGSIDDYEGPVWIWIPEGNRVRMGPFHPNGGNWT